MEAGADFAFDVGGVALFWNAGNDQRGVAPARSAAITSVGDGDLRTVSAQTLDLLESGFDRVPVIIVFRQTAGTQDDAAILADHQRRLGSELVFFMLLALGQAVNMRLVEGVNLVSVVFLLLQHLPCDGKPLPVGISFGHSPLQLAHDLPVAMVFKRRAALRARAAPHDLGREFRVGGKGDVLFLRGGVHDHFFLPGLFPVQSDGGCQDLLRASRSNPRTEVRPVRWPRTASPTASPSPRRKTAHRGSDSRTPPSGGSAALAVLPHCKALRTLARTTPTSWHRLRWLRFNPP